MNIVMLDGYAANPGDLSWEEFEKLGNFKVYDRTVPDRVLERVKDAEIILTNKAKVSAEVIENCPNLKYIGEVATGFDNIDIQAAAKCQIPVCNVPGYSTSSVVQLTWAFILNHFNRVSNRSDEVRNGAWAQSKDFSFGGETLSELDGKTLGLIGLGSIGAKVAKVGLTFGMNVIAAVRHPQKYDLPGIKVIKSYEEVFKNADVLSLHCPLTSQNKEMINKNSLVQMKSNCFLVNTARGGLIHEQDLADALNNRVIAGAGLDVLSDEPPKADNPLLKASNCVITPHIAWATKEARQRLFSIAADNIKAFLKGDLRNLVNDVKL